MKSRVAQIGLSLLMGLVLVLQGTFAISARGGVIPGKSSCCCAGCDMKSCSTPACCVTPAQPSTPPAPGPAPTSQNEWQALAAPICPTLAPPIRSAHDLSAPALAFFLVGPVPIFQRDCAYLI